MCPTLAVTTSVGNALWMSLATTFVLVCSNVLVSLVKSFAPAHIRIPVFITIIASFVTIVELTLNAFQLGIYKALGIYIPLIVVNCIILGRAEEFYFKKWSDSIRPRWSGAGNRICPYTFCFSFNQRDSGSKHFLRLYIYKRDAAIFCDDSGPRGAFLLLD